EPGARHLRAAGDALDRVLVERVRGGARRRRDPARRGAGGARARHRRPVPAHLCRLRRPPGARPGPLPALRPRPARSLAVLGPRLARVPVSATKSQLGHCLGAAGAIEAAVTVLALDEGIVPPTVGLRAPDPAWDDLDLVSTPGRRAPLGAALSSSYGFGG